MQLRSAYGQPSSGDHKHTIAPAVDASLAPFNAVELNAQMDELEIALRLIPRSTSRIAPLIAAIHRYADSGSEWASGKPTRALKHNLKRLAVFFLSSSSSSAVV